MQNENREIEVRFLEIDKDALVKKLLLLNAEDLGEDFLEEIIFYDKNLEWQYKDKKIVRLRKTKQGIFLAFKHNEKQSTDGVREIEFKVDNFQKAKLFLEEAGLIAFREQQKKRHTFKLDGVIIDIDTWPFVPTFVEFEGEDEESLKRVSKKTGFDWSDVVFDTPRMIIENKYKIPVSKFHIFTFDKME